MTTRDKAYVANLATMAKYGDNVAFCELERVAQPLLQSLARRFSNYHQRFEYDDFYNIGLLALYRACVSYDCRNPSFLDYAKLVMLREYWREIEYHNAEMRNVFENREILVDPQGSCLDMAIDDNIHDGIEMDDFRREIGVIISQLYKGDKAGMVNMYLLDDYRVCEIAERYGVKYKIAHMTVTRALQRVAKAYSKRFLDK
jgi:RNA polymerase sigma factor (sigma-70 family)